MANPTGSDAEKKSKTKAEIAEEIKAKRELHEKDQELQKQNEEMESMRKELEALRATKTPVAVTAPTGPTLEQLQAQINLLTRQNTANQGYRTKDGQLVFRQPTSEDIVDKGKEVTFISRSVFYVVGSYKDHNGIEQYPPHKIIVFEYASSDIRKEGREQDILNFSTYTTNLKTEIEFLRNNPFYGISFSENTNEMAAENAYETQFKIRAASQLSGLSPEAIFDRAREMNIPNWRGKTAEQLRYLIVHKMAEGFRKENDDLNNEVIKRRALAVGQDANKTE